MRTIASYRDLIAWQKAMTLPELVYQITEGFPANERYGLAMQMRRSAVSIPSSVAEGHSQSRHVYVRYLRIAIGSHSELCTQAELSFRLAFASGEKRQRLESALAEVGRITQGLLNSIRRVRPDP